MSILWPGRGSSARLGAVAVSLLFAVLPGHAVAQAPEGAYTAGALLEDLRFCDGAPSDYRCGRGATYVRGIVRRFAAGGDPSGQGGGRRAFCLDREVTTAELMAAVRDFLEANSARHSGLGAWAVRDAMILQYPCD